MNLLGVDVGFSKVQKSTGIAYLHDGELGLYRADCTWADRRQHLPEGFMPEMIAIDGPLLPASAESKAVRSCEQFFSKGLFCRRCKPGLSHFGTGFLLREAAREAVEQFGGFFYNSDCSLGNKIAEAFPNLFLGVLVSDADYVSMPKLKRGQKFDWLYGCAIGKLKQLAEFVSLPGIVYDYIENEQDHELRAGLICLLTAALAAQQKAITAGSAEGGWFWLPPLELWEPWAMEATRANLVEF